MTDSDIIKQIGDQLRSLNETLRAANRAGLKVQVDTTETGIVNFPHPLVALGMRVQRTRTEIDVTL